MSSNITLRRTLSLPMMVLYGLGTTIGAGIYALIGEIAAVAGYYAPASFLLASLMAGFTAVSFAELCARHPGAAGTALYIKKAFAVNWLSTIVGFLVIAAGLTSASALINGFIGYLHQFISIESTIAIILMALLLGGIAAWGIGESVLIASLITVIEIAGLLLVIAISGDALSTVTERWTELIPPADFTSWGYVYLGAMLSFYAFIGFEDMVVVAEEVKDVKRNLPLAILITLGITTIIYMMLMVSAVLSMPPSELALSEAPLAYLYEYHTGEKAVVICIIGMFAIINGALIQMIMATRVLYGLSSHDQLPAIFGVVHHRTRTPVFATALVTIVVLALSLIGDLGSLAEATAVIMLIVFALVNLALWRIKIRQPHPEDVKVFPIWVPITGFFISTMFVLKEFW
jgi:amino acid transporter